MENLNEVIIEMIVGVLFVIGSIIAVVLGRLSLENPDELSPSKLKELWRQLNFTFVTWLVIFVIACLLMAVS